MPPPAIALAEARLEAQKAVGTSSPNNEENRVEKTPPKLPDRIDFSRFPAEIQDMIWAEAIPKPACHTFRLDYEISIAARWYMELNTQISHVDPSAYRDWKYMLWKAEMLYRPEIGRCEDMMPGHSRKKGHGLANSGFQDAFRRRMIDLHTWNVTKPGSNWSEKAALDRSTDLVIIEFDRGIHAEALHWFEHSMDNRMNLNACRRATKEFKRVAVRYRNCHTNAKRSNPFQCYCPEDDDEDLGCKSYKACPMEQACFLDIFKDLEEFYYVVEVTARTDLEWMYKYREHLRRNDFKVKTSDDPELESAPFEVARFYDSWYTYIQLCPKTFFPFLPEELQRTRPLRAMAKGGPRECLVKVMDIYKGKIGSEIYRNSLEDRKKVKFGILFAYPLACD